ncbi:hypothetical protein Cantr_01014 [Candida viswanathii]|uniref:Uncharacterized protein n=1 Tax=Candida viswanathii TaxID=5486 RepID=A0A367YHJ8_9ASCO|nr:hypothetical protein Cantr_01014 [Candida viswanathii]
MSLFRSLQNSPSTISIFHNQTIPLSNKLYDILQKAYETQPEKPKHEFQIDVMKDKMPTYDEYKLITSKYLKSAAAKTVLHDRFPFLHDKEVELYNSKGNPVTIKGAEWNNKIFSPSEYAMIYETFNKLEESTSPSLSTKATEVFSAPLVIDWDNELIAGDEETLDAILAKYKQE